MFTYLYEFFGAEPPSDYANSVLTGVLLVLAIYCFVIFFWFISCLLRRKV